MAGACISGRLLLLLLLVCGCGSSRPPSAYTKDPAEGTCPERARPVAGLGLALSGGGYRATLFHAGALRRLNELSLLHRADEVSSVSGGSITSGQLAAFYQRRPGGSPVARIDRAEWNAGFAGPIHALARRDIRSGAVLEKVFRPWNWFTSDFAVQWMARKLDDHFRIGPPGEPRRSQKLRLVDLPEKPDFVFQATDLSFGVSWEFRPWRVGSYKTGYVRPGPEGWSLGQAVAASAAFPPVFNPMEVRPDAADYRGYYVPEGRWSPEKPARDQSWEVEPEACWKPGNWSFAMKRLRLQDGGVYDNLALEPVWKDRKILLVSDAGAPFAYEPDAGLLRRSLRWVGILDNQSRALRKRQLFGAVEERAIVTYWATHQQSDQSEEARGYSEEFAVDYIANVRTDLDVFSDGEQFILENHGYLVADAQIRRTVDRLENPRENETPEKKRKRLARLAEWRAFTGLRLDDGSWPELVAPHPLWLPAGKTGCELKKALYSAHRCKG